MQKVKLKEKFDKVILQNDLIPTSKDYEEFEVEFTNVRNLSDKEQIRIIEMLAKEVVSRKENSNSQMLMHTKLLEVSIWGTTDGVHWFKLPQNSTKSLKLPRNFFDDENPTSYQNHNKYGSQNIA